MGVEGIKLDNGEDLKVEGVFVEIGSSPNPKCIEGLEVEKEGKFIKSFGRKGEGPGEIREFNGSQQLHLTKNNLIIVDRSRIHYFSKDGTFKNYTP